MNIKEMLKAQKKLDGANFKKAGIIEYPLEEVKTAYRVELAEALQEWKGFKYWKLTRGEADREKLLEEIADCIHFALSLENYYQCYDESEEDIIDFNTEVLLKGKFIYREIEQCFGCRLQVIRDTLRLGLKLGFTLDELEEAYYKKNKINWERIKNNY